LFGLAEYETKEGSTMPEECGIKALYPLPFKAGSSPRQKLAGGKRVRKFFQEVAADDFDFQKNPFTIARVFAWFYLQTKPGNQKYLTAVLNEMIRVSKNPAEKTLTLLSSPSNKKLAKRIQRHFPNLAEHFLYKTQMEAEISASENPLPDFMNLWAFNMPRHWGLFNFYNGAGPQARFWKTGPNGTPSAEIHPEYTTMKQLDMMRASPEVVAKNDEVCYADVKPTSDPFRVFQEKDRLKAGSGEFGFVLVHEQTDANLFTCPAWSTKTGGKKSSGVKFLPSETKYLNPVQIMDSLCLPTIAGPSGTTKDMLHMMALLGKPSAQDMADLRAAMVAWMLPARDHSFTEVMLGAEPFMAPEFRMFAGDAKELRPVEPSFAGSFGMELQEAVPYMPVPAEEYDCVLQGPYCLSKEEYRTYYATVKETFKARWMTSVKEGGKVAAWKTLWRNFFAINKSFVDFGIAELQ